MSSTTLDRSALDTLQFWIATLLTLLANSLNSKKRSTVVQVRRWKTTPSSSSLEMPPSLSSLQASPCVSRLSLNTHHSVVSPSVTWDKLLPSVSSSPWTRRTAPERKPNPPRRQLERNNHLKQIFNSFYYLVLLSFD